MFFIGTGTVIFSLFLTKRTCFANIVFVRTKVRYVNEVNSEPACRQAGGQL